MWAPGACRPWWISLSQDQGTGIWPWFTLGASTLGYSVLEWFENDPPLKEKLKHLFFWGLLSGDGQTAYADLDVKMLGRTDPWLPMGSAPPSHVGWRVLMEGLGQVLEDMSSTWAIEWTQGQREPGTVSMSGHASFKVFSMWMVYLCKLPVYVSR